MENKLLDNFNEALKQSSKSSAVNIVNDKLTLSVFASLKKSLSRVREINLVLRDKYSTYNDKDLVREFELNPTEALFNAYDITQKNKLKHFEQARQMSSFIRTHVNLRKTTPKCQIKGNVLLVDDDFMIQGSSSLEMSENKPTHFSSINFDSVISNTMDKSQIVAAKKTFERIWNNPDYTIDYKQQILSGLEALYREHSPEFLYYFTLNELFGNQLDEGIERFENDNTKFKQSKIWNMLYDFQKDCVLSAIQKISKYNGCIIADSVGLGKTFEALAIIKYFELRQDNVLVLTPAKLYDNWNSFRGAYKDSILDESFYYKIMFHTDLSRYKGASRSGWDLARFDWGKFDLIVIDESHNFRNRIERDEGFTRYQRLLHEVIKNKQQTKVLLLSATPVNNSLNDLKNQISIITGDKDDVFADEGIESVANTLRQSTRVINSWDREEDKSKAKLLDTLPSQFYRILEKMTISRSRKHITQYYSNSGVGSFPQKLKPDLYTPHIDSKKELLDFAETNLRLEELILAVYIPMSYIKEEHKAFYREKYQTRRNDRVLFHHEEREFLTAKLHRFNLFKRLDSSIYAFHQTITRLLDKMDRFLATLESGEESQFNCADEFNEDEEDSPSLDYKYEIKVKHLKRDEYLHDLLYDKEILAEIQRESLFILNGNRDNKLKELIKILENKIQSTPYNPGNRKVIIFSAFADTARYLFKELSPLMESLGSTSAMLTGSDKPKVNAANINAEFNSVLCAFSPKAKLKQDLPSEEQIDVLIATDCISEGQNLQDCDCVINYDVQWNPVTLIQRFGRIDRIGSVNKQIKMINFFPDMELNEYLRLEERVKRKMITANYASTGGDDLLSPEMNDISFRSRQLERLRNEIIELEDSSDSLSLTDLNMNEYLYELAQYSKETSDLKKTPRGIYSIARLNNAVVDSGKFDSGVLFCFKHKNNQQKPNSDSALYPYYLIHVSWDGIIRYGNNQARELLKYFRRHAIQQKEPIQDLVNSFIEETDHCRNMSAYSDLLNRAIQSIQGQEVALSEKTVFNFGGFNNPFENEGSDDFELVSFLVVSQ